MFWQKRIREDFGGKPDLLFPPITASGDEAIYEELSKKYQEFLNTSRLYRVEIKEEFLVALPEPVLYGVALAVNVAALKINLYDENNEILDLDEMALERSILSQESPPQPEDLLKDNTPSAITLVLNTGYGYIVITGVSLFTLQGFSIACNWANKRDLPEDLIQVYVGEKLEKVSLEEALEWSVL
jgi:hypothetical protein